MPDADRPRSETPRGSLRPFVAWLVLFYMVWVGIILIGDHGDTLREHWGIVVAMLCGSYVAGSTPMGGGTIGFPILVLLFQEPATLGRDFSFAIQSIGMTSASIYILCRRLPLEWAILRSCMLGSLIGTPLGIVLVAPHVPGLWIKMIFAVVWASFGVLHLRRTRDICGNVGETPAAHAFDRRTGWWTGLLAGAGVASVTGVGIDMVLYAVMVLMMRADVKVAIPSSVVIMAFTSVVGVLTKTMWGGFQPGVYENWLAAAPIVALGAPLGAVVVARVGRQSTLMVVAILCVGQFVWTLYDQFNALGWLGLILAALAVLVCNGGFEWLWRIGDGLARRSPPPTSGVQH